VSDPDLSSPSGRLQWARRQAGYKSPRAAARARGWNENTYRAHESGRNRYREVEAKRYGQAFAVSWVWLMHELGQPKERPADVAGGFAHPGQAEYGAVLEAGGRLVPVREIDIHSGPGGRAAAAYRQLKNGSWVPSTAAKAQALLPEAWLFALELDPTFTDVVRMHGDAMSPAIEDGDWIFVDRRVWQFAADDIYLFWNGYAFTAKSLAVVPASHPPRIRILSINPKYPPDELPLDRIKIIGRVRFRMGRIVRQP
jgi:Peptidase S24-like